MKILLIGATGMIGSRILSEAVTRGHTVVAASRNADKVEANGDVTAVSLDVNDPKAVIPHAEAVDLIISAVSPRSTDDGHNEAVRFTQALIDVAKATRKRLLTVGGASSLHIPDGTNVMDLTPEFLIPEAGGMRKAYGMMVQEDIDFAVLAPAGMIEPGDRTGKFRLGGRTMVVGEDGGKNTISAEDFAVAMIDEAETPRHFRTIFNIGY